MHKLKAFGLSGEVEEVADMGDRGLEGAMYIEGGRLDIVVCPISTDELLGVGRGVDERLTMGEAVDRCFRDRDLEFEGVVQEGEATGRGDLVAEVPWVDEAESHVGQERRYL